MARSEKRSAVLYSQPGKMDQPVCCSVLNFKHFLIFQYRKVKNPPKILLLDYCKDRVNTCPQEWLWYIRNFITFCKNHPKFEIYSLYIAKY